MVKYYVHKSPLQGGRYIGKCVANEVVEIGKIVEMIVARGTTLTAIDARATLELLVVVVVEELTRGNHVNLGAVNFSLSMKGLFISDSDTYDSSRHTININVNAGKELTKVSQGRFQTEKVRHHPSVPDIIHYHDEFSNTDDSVVTPGEVGTLSGEKLKFDPADEEQGIFLIDSSGEETKVVHTPVNKPSTIVLKVPADLVPDTDYAFIVRNKTNGTILFEGSSKFKVRTPASVPPAPPAPPAPPEPPAPDEPPAP